MAIFLDTGKIKEVEKYLRMGIIRGVTTNPTILMKDGVTGGLAGIKERSVQIAGMIDPYPLSVEVTTNVKEEMVAQAREFSEWAENINIKITIHGPNGELDNLEVVHELEMKHNVRVNVTAMMSAQQGAPRGNGRGNLRVHFRRPGEQHGVQRVRRDLEIAQGAGPIRA